jgi:hypothetical protein
VSWAVSSSGELGRVSVTDESERVFGLVVVVAVRGFSFQCDTLALIPRSLLHCMSTVAAALKYSKHDTTQKKRESVGRPGNRILGGPDSI